MRVVSCTYSCRKVDQIYICKRTAKQCKATPGWSGWLHSPTSAAGGSGCHQQVSWETKHPMGCTCAAAAPDALAASVLPDPIGNQANYAVAINTCYVLHVVSACKLCSMTQYRVFTVAYLCHRSSKFAQLFGSQQHATCCSDDSQQGISDLEPLKLQKPVGQ